MNTRHAPATHIVGVDIGGTKTHVLCSPIEAKANDLRDIVVPSASWRTGLGDFAADAAGLRSLLVHHLGDAVLGMPLAVGAHGCENTAQCHELERSLRMHFDGPVRVVNDSELMAPAMGFEDGIGLVVGTGSIATARSGDGKLVTAGGWGWLLGDEGSAPALVREATRAVLAHLDRGGPLETLGARLMACFSARDAAELALAVTQNASDQAWGVHAPQVFAAADDGSALADDVIRNAGERLAGLVDRLVRRGITATAVVAGGSVIERQPRLRTALSGALARDRPGIQLLILDRQPVTGALALARRIWHETLTPLTTESSNK